LVLGDNGVWLGCVVPAALARRVALAENVALRILPAIAYAREKNKALAVQRLTSLRAELPANTLCPRETARLETAR
jgi:hypothetical protein